MKEKTKRKLYKEVENLAKMVGDMAKDIKSVNEKVDKLSSEKVHYCKKKKLR